jgi:hypothetical protein
VRTSRSHGPTRRGHSLPGRRASPRGDTSEFVTFEGSAAVIPTSSRGLRCAYVVREDVWQVLAIDACWVARL